MDMKYASGADVIASAQDDTRVVVVDTRDHILSTFDRALSMYADEQFARQGIDVIHNSRVSSCGMLSWAPKQQHLSSHDTRLSMHYMPEWADLS